MTNFKVINKGYAYEENGVMYACCSTTYVEDGKKKIVVDPGINKDLLLKGLRMEKIELSKIDCVYLTHYHPDHAFLVSLFPKMVLIDGETIYKGDSEHSHDKIIPETSIKIISTPGHTAEHTSLILNTNQGKVVVAGDVFWWRDDEEQDTSNIEKMINKQDSYANDFEALKLSRKKVLEIADWIIPGHGKMFMVVN